MSRVRRLSCPRCDEPGDLSGPPVVCARWVITRTDLVVAVATGHGLKQPQAPLVQPGPLHTVAPTLTAVEQALTRS